MSVCSQEVLQAWGVSEDGIAKILAQHDATLPKLRRCDKAYLLSLDLIFADQKAVKARCPIQDVLVNVVHLQ